MFGTIKMDSYRLFILSFTKFDNEWQDTSPGEILQWSTILRAREKDGDNEKTSYASEMGGVLYIVISLDARATCKSP